MCFRDGCMCVFIIRHGIRSSLSLEFLAVGNGCHPGIMKKLLYKYVTPFNIKITGKSNNQYEQLLTKLRTHTVSYKIEETQFTK